jgi:hypothetical protein
LSTQITQEAYSKWTEENFIVFATTSVETRRSGVMARLIFNATPSGKFKVTCGYDTLYEGDDFEAASTAYNQKLPL